MSADLPLLFGRAVRHVHCLGVGGMGVAPLAIYLARLGFAVTGEDDALSSEVRGLLAAAGVTIGSLPAEAELVAYSSAIAQTHPVYRAAAVRGLLLARRGELLAEVVRGKRLVAVCGSHGKTTTTAMLITALRAADFPAGYLLGGLFADGSSPADAGANDWVVAEIDESDGTINGFTPEITVVVNLDWDHPDHYPRLADLEATFAALLSRTRGAVLVSETCALSRKLAPDASTFGPTGDFSGAVVVDDFSRMGLRLGGCFTSAIEISVRAQGAFNAVNATAALAAAQLMGAAVTSASLGKFPGVLRRQTVLHTGDGLRVIEDYAHHPAEIRSLLASLRRSVGVGSRLIVVFQPHRFSRTAQFKVEFAAALALGDSVHLLDVYSAGEAPVAGGTTVDLAAVLKSNAFALPVSYSPSDDAGFFRALTTDVKRGDLVVFVGAGDIDRRARAWIESIRRGPKSLTRWDDFVTSLTPVLGPATKIKREESLAKKTTIRIGGAARVYAEPANEDDLCALLAAAVQSQIEVFVLGRGSNLVVPDDGVEGLVVSLSHEYWAKFEPRPDGRIAVGAGLRLKNLCGLAAKAGLVGFEFLEGIPGSVGGALRMNAGAMGGWMFDVVEEVRLVTLSGEIRTVKKSEMHVAYRHCAELHDAIALGAVLKPAAAADVSAVSRQIDVYRRKRQESQPREPSAGCIFKNPEGSSAGRLIDLSGLKGERVGDAEVSPVHANFIVNRGAATSADLIELVRRVRAKVRQAHGIELEPEVLLYGKNWSDFL